MTRPLPGPQALDAYFLEARSKLLDLAAILDRIDRGGGAAGDPRHARLREALAVLSAGDAGRAEKVQLLFSLAYDADWKRPTPR